MGGVGVWELIIILILVLIIFGGRRLPELGRGLGQGLANFRRAVGRGAGSDPRPGPDDRPGPPDEERR